MAIDPPPDAVVDDAVAFLDARRFDVGVAVDRVRELVDHLPTEAIATIRLAAPPPIGEIERAIDADVVTVIDEPPDVIVVIRVR